MLGCPQGLQDSRLALLESRVVGYRDALTDLTAEWHPENTLALQAPTGPGLDMRPAPSAQGAHPHAGLGDRYREAGFKYDEMTLRF